MTPGDALHQPGKEYILGAATLEQARLTYNFIRAELEPTGEYRWIDSTTRLGATHVRSNTKLRAISSNAKSSFGLVNVPLVVLDEPGALEIVGGQMLSDSLFTAHGQGRQSAKANSGWHICADGYERWALVVGLVEGRHQGADSRTAISGRRRDMGQCGIRFGKLTH